MKAIVALLKKDCRLHSWLFLVYWFALIVNFLLLYSSNEGIDYFPSPEWIALGITVHICSIDSSGPNAHWRMQPLSALQLCLAKLLLVFLFIILPTVVLHWLLIESLMQELHQYWVLEPLFHFLNLLLCAALLGATLNRHKPKLFIVYFALYLALEVFYAWLSGHFQNKSLLPIFEGDHATILSIGITVLLLISLWFIYLRRNITYNIPVAGTTLLSCWFFFKMIGPWITAPPPPQSKQLSEQASLTATDVQFNFFESYNASPEYKVRTVISPAKPKLKNYVFTSRGHLSNKAGFKRYFASFNRRGFDDGEFTFVHTQLGFASEKDRRLQHGALIDISNIKQERWNKSASTLNIELAYSEPVVSIIVDEPALANSEFSYQNHKFSLNSRIRNDGTLVSSVKGYSLSDFSLGIIVYRPDLKELLHTFGVGKRFLFSPILGQPKIHPINYVALPQFMPEGVHFSKGNSLGYRSLLSHPNKEWLADARVMVYVVNHTKPIVEKLTLEKNE